MRRRSVMDDFRKRLRAGVLKNKSRTRTVVPRACGAGALSTIDFPSTRMRQPSPPLWSLEMISKRDTDEMLASASPRKP
jgi:hypothetical protein